jgi:hypothetical protein
LTPESCKDDYRDKDDITLLSYLFLPPTSDDQHYAHKVQSLKKSLSEESVAANANTESKNKEPKFDFTACYSKKDRQMFDDLEEYLKLHPEDFGSCSPFQWWQGRRAQFPNLYHLATDVLSIPGNISNSFVLVGELIRFCHSSRAHLLHLSTQ